MKISYSICRLLVVLVLEFLNIHCNSNTTLSSTSSTITSIPITTVTPSVKPTLSPEEECNKLSGQTSSCEACVKVTQCYWCKTNSTCELYPYNKIFPRDCDLSKARWGVCWVNFQDLIIAMGVIGGLIIISLSCCVYCCCCSSNKSTMKRYAKTDAKLEREREERRIKNEEKRAERKVKNDEIRKKYGLMKDDNPYQRFENN